MTMPIWTLKSSGESRFRAGHPWVRSQDLTMKERVPVPGGAVELFDSQGRFLARGYGNPKSKISFRVVTRDPMDKKALSPQAWIDKAITAWKLRRERGFQQSFRWIFSEGDFLPGLIVDRYLILDSLGRRRQVLAMQVLTAGAQRAIGDPLQFAQTAIRSLHESGDCELSWDESALVLRNDVRTREAEGLAVEPPRFVQSFRDVEFDHCPVLLGSEIGDPVLMEADLYQGQKTGLFLDQSANITEVVRLWSERGFEKGRPVRVLDLCCYVGQWSTRLSEALIRQGFSVHTTLVDVSASALAFAKKNAEKAGAQVELRQGDVMKMLTELEGAYDLVIADPPAFIKAKKDLPLGRKAYLKLNTGAFRLASPGGWVVSCSCSGLMPELEFEQIVQESAKRAGRLGQTLFKGGPSADHPSLSGFPEGRYLKMQLTQA